LIYLQDTGGEEATKADAGDSEVTESKADEEGEVTEPKVDNNGEVTAPEEQPQEEDPYQNSPVEIPTRYPGGIYQDDVGRPYEHSHVCGDDHADTEPLLADDDNMLARRRWPGGIGIAVVDREPSDGSDDGSDGETDRRVGDASWDDMFMGSYFNVVGFLFKLNALRLDEKQLPKAIGLLLCFYMCVAIYVANVIVGALMVYVGHKYRELECEENLSGWLLIMGVYICCSALISLLTIAITVVMKRDLLAVIRNLGGLFALVWFIIGCVRTYKIDPSNHKCNDVVFDFSYYYLTITLSTISFVICCSCCAGIALATRQTDYAPDG